MSTVDDRDGTEKRRTRPLLEKLRREWAALVERHVPVQREGDYVWANVVRHYAEPHRRYHDFAHIDWCIDLLHEMWGRIEPARDTAELALWFHDIHYNPLLKDNEERSGLIWGGFAAVMGFDLEYVTKVSEIIIATHHKASFVPPNNITAWVLDIDLASLGFSPKKFDENSAQIREEYSFVPEEAFLAGRKAVLQGFLDRPRIYLTDECFKRFEAQARENLTRAIKALV